jgi:serine/threonine protein kinase
VAIKVLPAAVAKEGERLARFRRETQLLAALNHPNIAAIYGLEESDGRVALVLELVEGEDLAERLKRGALPVDEAMAVAKQIAEALEGAHEKGVVHRDLEPANIKLTLDGKVKVLDFGLAKAWTGDGTGSASSADVSHSPTMTRGTEAGLILGTAAYMSPEQARGKTVNKRADIIDWSQEGRSLLVYRPMEMPARVERLELSTGQRTPFRELAPADRAGAVRFQGVSFSADEKSYAYTVSRFVGALYTVEGVR